MKQAIKYMAIGIVAGIAVGGFALYAGASFNEQINYQGKLTDANGVAVADGQYCMKFRLMDALTVGNELWNETWTAGTSKVSVASGLFSIMLGTHVSLSSLDLNNASRYLEVQFDPGCDTTYEEVFAPRKQFGAVPAAFEAKQLGGNTWAVPGAIGSTTPNSGAFTSLSASSTLTTSNGSILSSAAGVLTLGGSGGSYNENLTLDFETTSNSVGIGTGTGVTGLNLGSLGITTSGAIGGGAITGTSFVIGANTISSFANLDSLADLYYSSTSFVKMTGAGTFALDTNSYVTSETDPVYISSSWYTTTNNSVNWDSVYSNWGSYSPSSFVPYTGASSSVDLGSQTLTTSGLGTFSGAGGVKTDLIQGAGANHIDIGNTTYGAHILAELQVDGNLTVGKAAVGVDYTLTFNGESDDGVITYDEDNNLFNLADTKISTTGTLGAGAITGTSFVIGANTISSFANLDSLADLSYSSTSFVKMTGAGTFALDITTYEPYFGYGTYLNQAVLTSSAPSFSGLTLSMALNMGSQFIYLGSSSSYIYSSGGGIDLVAGGGYHTTIYNDLTAIGGVTAASFVIGANTISSFANLDSLADLSYASASFVKMTGAGTFALDTASYLANPMDAIGQIIYGGASGAPTKLTAGSSGQILQSGGAGAPAWTTATFPATATGTGTILRADGTNWVASTATYPTTTTANQVLYSTATSVVGGSANLTFDGTNLQVAGAGASQILSSSGLILLGGTGQTYNEDLTFDFETTANEVALTSSTGVTVLDFGTIALSSGSYISGTPIISSVVGSGPPGTSPADGAMIIDSGDGGRLYIRYGSAWHYIAQTAGFQIPDFETTDPISGDKMEEGDIVLGMLNQTFDDGAMHGVWVKWDSVKEQLLAEARGELSQSGALGSGSVSGVSTETLADRVANILASIGISVKDGVASITNLVTEKIATKTARIEKLEMVDSATGDIYCTWVKDGEWQKVKGDCGSLAVANADIQPSEQEAVDRQIDDAVLQIQQVAQETQDAITQSANDAVSQVQQQIQEQVEQVAPTPTPAPTLTPGETSEPEIFDIVSITSVSDIGVEYGTDITSVGLPQTVSVTLSDDLTQDVAVTWDGGTPTYNANAPGAYLFSGNLSLSENVTNTNNLMASVNVAVAEQPVEEPQAENPIEATVNVIEEAASTLINGAWNFIRWIFGSTSKAASSFPVIQKAGASLMQSLSFPKEWLSPSRIK